MQTPPKFKQDDYKYHILKRTVTISPYYQQCSVTSISPESNAHDIN